MFKLHPDGEQLLINLAGCVVLAGDTIFGDPTETTPQGRTNAMRLVERFLQEAEQRGFKHTGTVWALMRRNDCNQRLANLVQDAMNLIPNSIQAQIIQEVKSMADAAPSISQLVTATKYPGQHEPESNPRFTRPGPDGVDPRFWEAGHALSEIRKREGNAAIHKPEHAHLYAQMHKFAPESFKKEMTAMAEEMGLMPKATHVGADGQAIYTSQQIADKHGVSVEEVERFIAQADIGPDDLYSGPVFPLQ
nr:hypothetical protein [Comamonas thiooxydans]